MGTMTKRFLQLDDIRSMNDVDPVASVFGRLGYNPLQGSPEIAIEDLQLSPKSAESIWKTHLIADRSQGAESLQVLLFQLHPDELAIPSAIGNRMRLIAQSPKWETEIDDHVARLYGLTPDEIKLIRGE